MFEGLERLAAHRHTGSAVYYVAQGRGRTIIDGQAFGWSKGSVIALPSCALHEHANLSDTEDAILFSIQDRPALLIGLPDHAGAAIFRQVVEDGAQLILDDRLLFLDLLDDLLGHHLLGDLLARGQRLGRILRRRGEGAASGGQQDTPCQERQNAPRPPGEPCHERADDAHAASLRRVRRRGAAPRTASAADADP